MSTKFGRSSVQSGKKFSFFRSSFPIIILFLGGALLSIRPIWWQSSSIVPIDIPPALTTPSLKQRLSIVADREYPRVLQHDSVTNEAIRVWSNITYSLGPAAVSYRITTDDNEEESAKGCQFMHDWQTQTYPTCNDAHEINMRPETGSVVFINCGGTRCAFRIVEADGSSFVLKIPKFKKEFEARYYEKARKDGMSMERLQRSPYILDIYGYCGLSQLIEPGEDGGNTHDLIKTTRLKGDDALPLVERLKIVYQLASGVADMHSFEEDGLVSLVHNDICCHQFIFSHGIYKLNDFHMANFQRKSPDTNQVCTATNGYNGYVRYRC
eukprot:scaffold25830_cov162-Cylindrotheca_fusiformis.AAC.9